MRSPGNPSPGSEGDSSRKSSSMFSPAMSDQWSCDGFIRPPAQNIDDVLLVTSVGATQVADTFALDGVSMSIVIENFFSQDIAFKENAPQRVFFTDDCHAICVIDYSPTRDHPVQIRRVNNVYEELREGDVASFGVLQTILREHPEIFPGASMGNQPMSVFAIANDFASSLRKFIQEE